MGCRVGAVGVFEQPTVLFLDNAAVVGVGGGVTLGEGNVTGSEITYSVVSVRAGLSLALVEETGAGRGVTIRSFFGVEVMGTVVTRERRCGRATLTCSTANCDCA